MPHSKACRTTNRRSKTRISSWSGAVSSWPTAEGRIRFRVPKGLQNSNLYTIPPDETIAYKTRLTENGPLKFWGGGQLGIIDADRKITIVSYSSPTVLATVQTDEGEMPDDVEVSAGFNVRGGDFGERFIRQSDGRFRSHSLMPDHEYEISAGSPGYVRIASIG